MAYDRIRRQDTELEALRPDPSHLAGHGCRLVGTVAGGAYEQGRELNAYLMAAASDALPSCATQRSLKGSATRRLSFSVQTSCYSSSSKPVRTETRRAECTSDA